MWRVWRQFTTFETFDKFCFDDDKINWLGRSVDTSVRGPARAVWVRGMTAVRVPARAAPRAPPWQEPGRRTCRVGHTLTRASRVGGSCSSSWRVSSAFLCRASIDAPPGVDPTSNSVRKLFCFGLGYTSLGLASTLLDSGWEVSGTCRSEDRALALQGVGITAFVWCPSENKKLTKDGTQALRNATHVLVSVPPNTDSTSGETARGINQGVEQGITSTSGETQKQGIADGSHSDEAKDKELGPIDPVLADTACAAILNGSQNLKWLAYLSTTGVYGDHSGGWIDEATKPKPVSDKTKARHKAELEWVSFADKARGHLPLRIFRLAGVYGPRRSVLGAAANTFSEVSDGPTGNGPGIGIEVSDGPAGGGPDGIAQKKPTTTNSASKQARSQRKFTSRCHVHDVVSCLCASIKASHGEEDEEPEDKSATDDSNSSQKYTYNVVDDDPASRAVAVAFATRLLANTVGDEEICESSVESCIESSVESSVESCIESCIESSVESCIESSVESTMLDDAKEKEKEKDEKTTNDKTFFRGEKRVANAFVKTSLGVSLRFPSYRKGLTAIHDGHITPFSKEIYDVL